MGRRPSARTPEVWREGKVKFNPLKRNRMLTTQTSTYEKSLYAFFPQCLMPHCFIPRASCLIASYHSASCLSASCHVACLITHLLHASIASCLHVFWLHPHSCYFASHFAASASHVSRWCNFFISTISVTPWDGCNRRTE